MKFTTVRDEFFAGRRVPKGSACQFWETRNFGFLAWTEPSGERHLQNY